MKWLINIFLSIFTGGNKNVPKPTEPVITPPSSGSTGPKKTVCLILGHSATGADKGAMGYDNRNNLTSEVEYNTYVMFKVQQKLKELGINILTTVGSSSVNAVSKANGTYHDIAIQMHLNGHLGTKENGYTSAANGCEVLVIKGDTKSYPLAEKFAKDFTDTFSNVVMRRTGDKGKKILASSDRGATSVTASGNRIKFLVEPFFIDNRANFVDKDKYVDFLVKFISEIV